MIEENLLKLLEKLRLRLEASHVQQYNYLISHSDLGEKCTYAIRSRQLFETLDKQEILDLIRQIVG